MANIIRVRCTTSRYSDGKPFHHFGGLSTVDIDTDTLFVRFANPNRIEKGYDKHGCDAWKRAEDLYAFKTVDGNDILTMAKDKESALKTVEDYKE